MRTVRLVMLLAIMGLWLWIAWANFGHSAEWTLPGLSSTLSSPVGFLMLVSFVFGAVPMWLIHKVSRWTWRRKLTKAEARLADSQTAPAGTAGPLSAADAETALLARARAAGGVSPGAY